MKGKFEKPVTVPEPKKVKVTNEERRQIYSMIDMHACNGCGCNVETEYVTFDPANLQPRRVDCACGQMMFWSRDGYVNV